MRELFVHVAVSYDQQPRKGNRENGGTRMQLSFADGRPIEEAQASSLHDQENPVLVDSSWPSRTTGHGWRPTRCGGTADGLFAHEVKDHADKARYRNQRELSQKPSYGSGCLFSIPQ